VIPFEMGSADDQPPPDLASVLLAERVVYLGMPLSPSVHELLTGQFLYLQHENIKKLIYLYINSTGTTKVIPFEMGSAEDQPLPDLASVLLAERVVYLGMPLSPSVHELLTAQFLYLQHENIKKPIYLYINSTETTK
ncbi:ATP-dependent Clp protease proteolytic subunit, partial [Striga asiatica]